MSLKATNSIAGGRKSLSRVPDNGESTGSTTFDTLMQGLKVSTTIERPVELSVTGKKLDADELREWEDFISNLAQMTPPEIVDNSVYRVGMLIIFIECLSLDDECDPADYYHGGNQPEVLFMRSPVTAAAMRAEPNIIENSIDVRYPVLSQRRAAEEKKNFLLEYARQARAIIDKKREVKNAKVGIVLDASEVIEFLCHLWNIPQPPRRLWSSKIRLPSSCR